MTTASLIALLLAIELALVALALAFYFYRKAKRLASGEFAQAEPPVAAVSLSYSQALRQQVAMTREFINTATNVAHRTLAERRLQYLEAELAAYLTDDRLPNWDILSPLLAGLFTIPSINASLDDAQPVSIDDYGDIGQGDSVDVWHVLSGNMLAFLVSASRQCELLNDYCQGKADTGELFVVFDQSSQTQHALSHALDAVIASLGQPMAELDELRNHIESHQSIVGSCADAIAQQDDTEVIQAELAELVSFEQMITDIALTLQIVDPAELARLTAPRTDSAQTLPDDDGDLNGIEFMVMGDEQTSNDDSDDTVLSTPQPAGFEDPLLPPLDDPIDMMAIDDIMAVSRELDNQVLNAPSQTELMQQPTPSTDELLALQMLEMNLSDGEDEFKDMSDEELMALQMMEFNQTADETPAEAAEPSTDELMAQQMMELNELDTAQGEGGAKP